MKTSRRSFLASLVAAVLGRSLFRKPAPAAPISFKLSHTQAIKWTPGDGSLFSPRENLAAQYKALHFHRDAFTLVDSAFQRGFATIRVPLPPSPIEFDPHFGVDFDWNEGAAA